MTTLIVGLLLFIGIHSVAIVSPQLREAALHRFGELAWKGFYSVIAIAGFVLIVKGYAEARLTPLVLYDPPGWLAYVALVLLLPVFPLLLAAYLPGVIQRVSQHPMLAAVKLWALAHLLVNGTLADVVLFGSLLAWAVADRISLKRRPTPSVPRLPAGSINDGIAVVGGLALYAAFAMGLHHWLIGVPVAAG